MANGTATKKKKLPRYRPTPRTPAEENLKSLRDRGFDKARSTPPAPMPNVNPHSRFGTTPTGKKKLQLLPNPPPLRKGVVVSKPKPAARMGGK